MQNTGQISRTLSGRLTAYETMDAYNQVFSYIQDQVARSST